LITPIFLNRRNHLKNGVFHKKSGAIPAVSDAGGVNRYRQTMDL